MPRVLFVCLGNICRSPTGEGVFRSYLSDQGLEGEVEVDSAGTGDWHVGERADPRMRRAAESRGFRLDSIARQVTPDELGDWDLVVAMDESNLQQLRRLDSAAGARIHLLSEFLASGAPRDVPDPYYGGHDGFDRVIDLIESACPVIVERLLEK
jgi:protein-tyrosine phosphatase